MGAGSQTPRQISAFYPAGGHLKLPAFCVLTAPIGRDGKNVNSTIFKQQRTTMSSFDNVSIERAANIYFDGKVTSRTVIFADGEKKTLGIMMPGDYRFDTALKELMEIQAGSVSVRLPGEDDWREIAGGESFEVPANSAFDIKVNEVTDYCCSYIAE